MRVFVWRMLALLLLFSATAPATAAEFKKPVAKMQLEDGDTLVFLGDSITHQCLYTQYVEDFFYTRFPEKRIRFHNAGVGGAKAWDALERFDADVAAYKPKYVTILLGMNDGRYTPYNEEIFRTYHKDMTEVVARIKKAGATPILMTPTMYDSRAARIRGGRRATDNARLELYNSVLAYYGTWLREVAVKNGYGFVDMYSPLNNLTLQKRKTEPNFTLIADAVHPGPSGQLVMAYAIIDDMGLRGPVSNIRILSAASKKPKAQGRGGKVTNLKKTEDGLTFTFLARSLPWVLPEEAKVGVDILKLGHRASREGLEVHGLKPGRYELTIDGKHIGVYTHTALSRHIELQANEKTPQYQQALKIAELNKQRNAGPVRALRGEWSIFQRYSRAAAQLKANPNDKNAQKQVDTWKQKLAGRDQRIAKAEADAKKIEDQIFKINKPKPRTYVLKPAPMSKTTLRLNLDGKPVAGTTVRLVSDAGVIATGRTDRSGNAQLKTGNVPGTLPGQYRVVIDVNGSGDKADCVGVPVQYTKAATTTLRVEVQDSENAFEFNLKSK